MKIILLCIPNLINAGAQRFVTELACNMNKDKYKPVVVVTNELDTNLAFYVKLKKNKIDVIDVSSSGYLKELVNIVRLLRKIKPDIIHSNVGSLLHMIIPVWLSRTSAPHLFTVHSMGFRIFKGIKKYVVKYLFKRKKVIPIAICDTVKKSIVDSYNLKDDCVDVVYNGVDTHLFRPSKKENDLIVFVSTGTLYEIKNHDLLIDAFFDYHRNNPNAILRIIGDGPLKEKLVLKVKKLKLEQNVYFEGSKSEIASILNESDVYCCSSIVEGLPLAVLEAMACGLPIITTPAGGVIDIVKNGYNGYVVPADAKKYAQKMNECACNYNERKKMGENSRKMAELYDIKNCCRGYEVIYEKMQKSKAV